MTDFLKNTSECITVNNAIEKAKENYDYHCIVSGQFLRKTGELHGCHLFPRDLYPELVASPLNIFPIVGRLHTGHKDSLDKMVIKEGSKSYLVERPINDRINYLVRYVHKDHRQRVMIQLELLSRFVNKLGVRS